MNIRFLLIIACVIVFGLSFAATTTKYNFDSAWSEVTKLQEKGLPKSMLDKVDEIYNAAIRDGNTEQQVKALIYKLTYLENVEENSGQKAIKAIEEELVKSTFPTNAILHSMLAQLYWSYYERNRWQFQNRTETVNFIQEDISTWDLKTITKKTIAEYKKSIENQDALKKLSVSAYKLLIKPGDEETQRQRPTLYDFLAHRALDFYINDESGITKPADEFSLSNNLYFQSAESFGKMNIVTSDTLSLKFIAIKIMQELIDFHLHDKAPDALIAIDIDRLQFAYENSHLTDAEILYESALRNQMTKYADSPISALSAYTIAKLTYELGANYKADVSEKYRWNYKNALELCNATLKKYADSPEFDRSYANKSLKVLKANILNKTTDIQIESVSLKDQPIRAMVEVKNLNQISVRIYKLKCSDKIKDDMQYSDYEHKELQAILKSKPRLEKKFDFPSESDYRQHSFEIALPGLSYGRYLMVVSDDFGKNLTEQNISYRDFSCSDLSFVTQNNERSTILVLSRQFGTPRQNVYVKRYIQKWDEKASKYVYSSDWTGKTNRFGKLKIPKSSGGYWARQYLLYKDDDSLFASNLYVYENNRVNTIQNRCILFTDRGIYRPGQTVYFKGILYKTDYAKYNKVSVNQDIKVTFFDVNRQEISSLNFKTNQYGSFNGTFTAPKNTLTGIMQIYTEYGSTSFSVEEYKRPTFEVTIDKPVDEYQLGQLVSVKGKVLSYAGFPIDNAKVAYRIVRQPRWHFWYWWWGSHGSAPEKEIIQGAVNTNEKGEFELSFIAQSDDTVSNVGDPYFVFTINADATDQNGETRSGSLGLAVGNTNLILDPIIPATVSLDKKKLNVPIKTTNLSGESVPVNGSLKISRLKAPERVLKNRIWNKPDRNYLKSEEFIKLFPHDIYEEENLMSKWSKEKQVFSGQFDTSVSGSVVLNKFDEWEQGAYVLEAVTRDKNQKEVKATRYFTLYSTKNKYLPYPMADWFAPVKTSGEPGESASFLIGSGYEKVSVLYELERDNQVVDSLRFNLNKEQRLFTVPIRESDRGNFSVHFTFVYDNRVYTHNQDVIVPWSDKKLEFEYMTFRNKLLPGQDEEWRLKIKDHTGGKATAEILATMYDASLDAFRNNDWYLYIYNSITQKCGWSASDFVTPLSLIPASYHTLPGYPNREYSSLNWYNYQTMMYSNRYRGMGKGGGRMLADGVAMESISAGTMMMEKSTAAKAENGNAQSGVVNTTNQNVSEDKDDGIGEQGEDLSGIQARSNFAETAFFYPELRTDENGEVSIVFTAPESLTRWKFRALALTADLQYGITDSTMVTQKPLMVIPNAPRFLREGDKITFASKITSMDENDQSGVCQLFLFDAITMKPVESLFKLKNAQKNFKVKKGESTVIEWDIQIPFGVEAVTYRVVAKTGNFSDGEEKTLPVLTNRMLVTESLPLPVRGHKKQSFVFEKLKNSASSNTIKNFKLTLEYTSNPAWYAVQALPYMMEYPYDCNEQVFTRYYANSIASFIANSNPRIKKVFDSWKNTPSSEALLSNLEKNEELKSVILQETPWVLDAKNETERKHRVALLFDLNKMADEYERNLNKLQQTQLPSGAWSWFNGMPDSWWVTQYIVEGFGHLDKLGVQSVRFDERTWGMNLKAVTYLDRKIVEDYDRILKYGNEKLDNLGYMEIHYLYTRSFFPDITMDKSVKKAVDYFKGQAEAYWLTKGKYGQGMLALAMKRYGNKKLPTQIIASLKEHALNSQEMGMYWKDNTYGWFWYEAPIETQALLIEAFSEVTSTDTTSVDGMRTWLLKQKQTTNWKTTKATAEACYALLLSGTEWLTNDKLCEIKVDDKIIDPTKLDGTQVEAGTGYFKTSWSGGDIKPSMANVTVTNPNDVPSWGAMYWQYFENLDKITPAETPLKLDKKLFIERKTATGLVLDPISSKTILHVGDKVIVRIELRTDRAMEYVHMKDMRSSGFEPINVISQYKWQDGLGYYEATGDASTNFFIEYLRKGTYVFEYPLWVTNKGDFSNGITTIQCMYAPEFTSHSEGIRVEVK